MLPLGDMNTRPIASSLCMQKRKLMEQVRQAERPSKGSDTMNRPGIRPLAASVRPSQSRFRPFHPTLLKNPPCPAPPKGSTGKRGSFKVKKKLSAGPDLPLAGRRARSGMLTHGEEVSVTPMVQEQYQKLSDEFNAWRTKESLLLDETNLDRDLADYLDVKISEGSRASVGEKIVAAVSHFSVSHGQKLPRAQRTLKGFRRTRGGSSRLPLPDCVVAGIAAACMSVQLPSLAMAIFAGMHLLARPGEITLIRKADLHPPQRSNQVGLNVWTVTIADREVGRLSKTGTMDDTIPVVFPKWLGPMMGRLVHPHAPSEAPLFGLTNEEFAQGWGQAIHLLGIRAHRYQLRHAGAASALVAKRHTEISLMSLGRWRTLTSVRRYAKANLIKKSLGRLSPELKAFCEWSLTHMEQILLGRVPVKLPVRPAGPPVNLET